MLELAHHNLYSNYAIYLCPKCHSNNMSSTGNDKCHDCGYIIKNTEMIQKMIIKRIHYYIKGDKSD